MSDTATATAPMTTAYKDYITTWLDVDVQQPVARVRDVYDLSDITGGALQELNRIRALGLARPTVPLRGIQARQP